MFLTRNYVSKVTGDNASDNCKLEFNHAGNVQMLTRNNTYFTIHHHIHYLSSLFDSQNEVYRVQALSLKIVYDRYDYNTEIPNQESYDYINLCH